MAGTKGKKTTTRTTWAAAEDNQMEGDERYSFTKTETITRTQNQARNGGEIDDQQLDAALGSAIVKQQAANQSMRRSMERTSAERKTMTFA